MPETNSSDLAFAHVSHPPPDQGRTPARVYLELLTEPLEEMLGNSATAPAHPPLRALRN